MTIDGAKAGELLGAVLGEPYCAMDNGPHFSCGEIDSMVSALLLLDQRQAAATWLIGHADGEDEDEGDSHLHLQGTQDDPETSKAAWIKVEEYLNALSSALREVSDGHANR